MWFSKQGDALKYHDGHPDHIIIAKDISRFGHKKYGVFPRSHVDIFQGPYNELIRTNAVCRLYFDLDGERTCFHAQTRLLPKSLVKYVRTRDHARTRLFCVLALRANFRSTLFLQTYFSKTIGNI